MRAGEGRIAVRGRTVMVKSEPLLRCVRCVHIRNVANFKF